LLNPKFVNTQEAIAIHDFLIEKYGGSFGLRDEGLLESALAQPQASFFGEFFYLTIAEQAAVYLYHICKNHPFINGNKLAESKIDKPELIEVIRHNLISIGNQ
jgi:death on curing protein